MFGLYVITVIAHMELTNFVRINLTMLILIVVLYVMMFYFMIQYKATKPINQQIFTNFLLNQI